jgi:hypothetical protein
MMETKNGDVDDWFRALDCEEVLKKSRQIPTDSTWMLLRGAYQAVVGPVYSTISPLSMKDGFQVPVFVEFVEAKGRGVFATNHVKEGTVIWKNLQSASFYDGEEYRRFLASIPPPLACDVIEWNYIELEHARDPDFLRISVDLDAGSLINTVSYQGENNLEMTPGVGPEGRMSYVVASRDIQAGEELIQDYKDFEVEAAWNEFGL